MRHNKNRFIYMVLLGVLITIAMYIVIPKSTPKAFHFYNLLISIFITVVVWEGNLRIDYWLNKKYPWITRTAKRIVIHLILSVGFSAFIIFSSSFVFNCFSEELSFSGDNFMKITLIALGVLVLMSIILLSVEISTQFFKHWKTSLIEIEKYRAESLQAQLQNLKNQLNPHFLFNNMSVLSSLVHKDPDKAVEFINQLSKVYRYLLDNQNIELVSVEQELLFIRSYVFLLHIRFDKSLNINIEIPKEDKARLIPPMALQIIIENAIKHNESSLEHPLFINISSKGEKIMVENNLQLRLQHQAGSKTGLQNIKDRYAFFTDQKVDVTQNDSSFIVEIPLLFSK